ncbi:hypothetical protein EXIGLDRAFT_759900 [Exidia glandulosa HHB12029]|uniref:Uncharacterized protein n=1 Tax=Exidia glandulosa HHB12029 TaxID=1314781 RepID=A0A165PMT5_EXIGL|nr:hypothetical protein EXIGLDRAFT_759900 [Exidia glandulosa HHB12029]
MASAKKLSNGTLSLRFMQKAKNLQTMREEAEPTRILHEAEWIVPGYRPSKAVAREESVSYENSYIPFIYDGDEEVPPKRTSGRRVFKHGKEIEHGAKADEDQEPQEKDEASDSVVHSKPSTSHYSPNRKPKKEHQDDQDTPPPPPIPSTTPATGRAPVPTGFLRPGGVDAPPPVSGRKLGSVAAALLNKKPKREPEEPTLPSSQPKKKRKKEATRDAGDD